MEEKIKERKLKKYFCSWNILKKRARTYIHTQTSFLFPFLHSFSMHFVSFTLLLMPFSIEFSFTSRHTSPRLDSYSSLPPHTLLPLSGNLHTRECDKLAKPKPIVAINLDRFCKPHLHGGGSFLAEMLDWTLYSSG